MATSDVLTTNIYINDWQSFCSTCNLTFIKRLNFYSFVEKTKAWEAI